MTQVLYPEVGITRREDSIAFQTTCRKLHEGKWYQYLVVRSFSIGKDVKPEEMEQFSLQKFAHFHTEIYTSMLLMQVHLDAVMDFGWKKEKIFTLDPDQRSEEERIKQLMDEHINRINTKEEKNDKPA